jgi:hypothetical protein
MGEVTNGIIGGVVASLLVALVGVLSLNGPTIAYMTNGAALYFWLLLLTIIMVGQFVFTYTIMEAWSATPKQKNGEVV